VPEEKSTISHINEEIKRARKRIKRVKAKKRLL
jgi:hypothetical protein